MKRILYILAIALSLAACTDEIDKSNRYTFTGETVADYVLNRSDKYSHFIEILERAKLMTLLSTYGQHTLFLPTNEAIERFLIEQDSIYWATRNDDVPYETGITSPLLEDLSDSMATVIAKTHIIDAKYTVADMGEGTLQRRNYNLRSLGINYKVVDERFYVMINNLSPIIGADNMVENGVVHVMGKVIPPTSRNLPGVISDYKYFSLFNAALVATGFQDSLLLDKDEKFVPINYNALGYGTAASMPCKDVETKFFKYTGFIEPDEVFNEYGIYTLDDLKAFAEKWYGTKEKGNYKHPDNALYKFVAYHFVEREIAYNDIIFHNFKYTNKYWTLEVTSSEDVMLQGYDRTDYFESMLGPLMKVTKPLSTTQGADIFINYSKREIPFNPELRHHVNVRIIPPTEFTTMKEEYANFNHVTLNGIINPIDRILIYNEDEMVGNILNERMRFDIATLLPELSCNKLRYYEPIDGYGYIVPLDYCKDVTYNVQRPLLYLPGVVGYFGDMICATSNMDLSIRLPNVPARTYELRISLYGTGLVQPYIDGKITGIPIEFYTDPEKTGYEADEKTEDGGAENDKLMRNRGWMKLPDTYNIGNDIARNCNVRVRRILTKKYFGAGDHWLRLKCVSDGHFEADIDFIEFVPLNIISDPNKPEDRH